LAFKSRLLFFFFFAAGPLLQGASCEVIFEKAAPSMAEFLVNFAIESNDIYYTRKSSLEAAKEVFAISDSVFKTGVVEILKKGDEIVEFYTLKLHLPTSDWFEHELGHLFVKAGGQGRRWGSILFRRAIFVAKEKGWQKLQWLSDPDAETFYLKMGGTITGYCENLLNPDVDLPIFSFFLGKEL